MLSLPTSAVLDVQQGLRRLLDAAVARLGLACLPSFLIRSDEEAGRLEVVLPSHVAKEIAISVVYPSRRYLPFKVRLVIDLLAIHRRGCGAR